MSNQLLKSSWLRVYKTGPERWYSISISSIDDDYSEEANLTLIGFGYHLSISLPKWIIPPCKVKHEYFNRETQTQETYWTNEMREYGISLYDDHFGIRYGRQSYDSDTEQSWEMIVPWLEYVLDKHEALTPNGYHLTFVPVDRDSYERRKAIEEAIPRTDFTFNDFDGEEIVAHARLSRWTWTLGAGWWSWLKYFSKSKTCVRIDTEFDSEMGRGKGSWKGGTHSMTSTLPDIIEPKLESAIYYLAAENDWSSVSIDGEDNVIC